MKHLFSIFSLLGLIGLSQNAAKVSASEIAVSIKPLHSLVTGVAGNTAKPYLLVAGNSSPHGFKFKPSQLVVLSTAKIIFYIDEDFETFMENALNSIPKSVKKVAVAKRGRVQFLPLRKGGAWEKEKHDGHNHGHDHGSNDMHVWLDPKNAVRMAKGIVRALSKVFPENKEIYRSNARKLVGSISKADQELENYFGKGKTRPFIVFHDAYQYFEKRYGLEGVGSITFDPHDFPSSKRLREVRKKLRTTKAACVFKEPQFSDRLVKTVVQGTSAKIVSLDPLGNSIKAGPEMYLSLIRQTRDSFTQCFQH